MDQAQLTLLIHEGKFPVSCNKAELIETHISWVILCDHMVFKIKKPVHYHFLDFSTLEKRHFYCQQEILLNRRLVQDVYLGVVPIVSRDGKIEIVLKEDEDVIDYAVMMTRLDSDRRMDLLLERNEVTPEHIEQIAEMLASFHAKTNSIKGADHLNVQHNFNDLMQERIHIEEKLGRRYGLLIEQAVRKSDDFIAVNKRLLKERSENGFIRDCHGDLHSRNIFLLEQPVIFDCIEFNPHLRQIDILSELAFFCMDLEAFGHSELSQYFMVSYTKLCSIIHSQEEQDLFIYFKAYRANVRAKVNALRLKDAANADNKNLKEACRKYLNLMNKYLNQLSFR